MGNVLGIDFGVSNSCVAYVDRGKPYVVMDRDRFKIVPSIAYIYKKQDSIRVMVGRLAKQKYVENPFCTIHSIKRFIGKSIDSEDVKKAQEAYYYIIEKDERVKSSHEADIAIKINEYDLILSPQDIAVYIFRYLLQMAEQSLKSKIKDAVITMPTTFKARYTTAMKLVGEAVGLNIVGLLDEPTASAYAFGYFNKGQHTIAVYDLGGGTFDFAVLRRGENGAYETLATMGDAWIGGDDFDCAISNYILKEFQRFTKNKKLGDSDVYKDGILITDKDILRAIRAEAEKAKISLSETTQTLIHVPNVIPTIAKGVNLDVRFSRDVLEYIVSDLIEETLSLSLDAIENAKTLDPNLKLDALVLVGGQARMPKVKSRLKEVFGDIIFDQMMPDEAIAVGAAIYGQLITSKT